MSMDYTAGAVCPVPSDGEVAGGIVSLLFDRLPTNPPSVKID